MPKVLRILNRFNLGGPTFNAAYLSKYLPDKYETILVGGMKDESEEDSDFIVKSLDIPYRILPEMRRTINFIDDRKAYKKISSLIREFKPDIVHTHAAKAGAIGRLAAYHNKVPVIVHTFHGHVFDAYFSKTTSQIYKILERNLAKKSDKIIAISENQKYDLSIKHKICNAEKIQIIPLGFDLSKFQTNVQEKRKTFREKYLIDEDEIAIGIIGRLVPIKNHKLFLSAVANSLANINGYKNIRVFIIGDGESRAEIEQHLIDLEIDFVDFNKRKVKATVTFTSWIKDIDFATSGLDIIALSSLNEGTPVSLIEAQAANKPIITTKVGGIDNVVIENSTAVLVENQNLQEFSVKLTNLILDEALRDKLSQNGWEHVKSKFHYTRLVTDMDDLYTQLLNSKKI